MTDMKKSRFNGGIMIRTLLFLLTLAFAAATHAEDMSIYEAEVSVDASAVNAAAAREKAMTEANRKALYAVTNRISAASSTDILDNLNDNQILNFISEVSVISEKVTDSRYLASLKITINAPILKAYLSEKNAPVTVMPETHVIIVPVYRENPAAAPLLWEENNTWYTAWQDNPQETGQITIKPARTTPENRQLLSAADASVLNAAPLGSLVRADGGSEVYVAEATLTPEGLKAELKSPRRGTVMSRVFEGSAPEIFDAAVEEMKAAVLQQIQQQTLAKENQTEKMTLVFNYASLREWLSLQQTIKNTDAVRNINIDSMGSKRAQMTIDYAGDPAVFHDNLLKQGLRLIDEGNFYLVEKVQP